MSDQNIEPINRSGCQLSLHDLDSDSTLIIGNCSNILSSVIVPTKYLSETKIYKLNQSDKISVQCPSTFYCINTNVTEYQKCQLSFFLDEQGNSKIITQYSECPFANNTVISSITYDLDKIDSTYLKNIEGKLEIDVPIYFKGESYHILDKKKVQTDFHNDACKRLQNTSDIGCT